MLLKNPWLYLIKYFKLIHLTMFALAVYVVYRTHEVYNFFVRYTEELRYSYNINLSNDYFSNRYLFVVFLIIIIAATILILFRVNKKPWFFYLFAIGNYAALMILLLVAHNLFLTMEFVIVDIRYVGLVRELFFGSLALQYPIIFFAAMRGIGFNLKQLNFDRELKELEITEENSEDIEVNVNINTDKYRTKFKRLEREFKAFLKEQKYMLLLIASVIIVWIGIAIYIDINVTNRIHSSSESIRIGTVQLLIDDVHVTNQNLRGERITNDDEQYVIVRFSLENSSNVMSGIDARRISLLLNDEHYTIDFEAFDAFADFGIGYNGQEVNNLTPRYFIAPFRVRSVEDINQAYFRYERVRTATEEQWYRIRISVIPARATSSTHEKQLKEQILFRRGALTGTTFTLNEAEIEESFEQDFEMCVNVNRCIEQTELIVASNPSARAVLRLNMEVDYDINLSNSAFHRAGDMIRHFGTLHFSNERNERETIRLRPIEAYHGNNNFYYEVPIELLESNWFAINFNIRGTNYVFEINRE